MPTQVFPAELTFIDQNGDPLSGGKVFMYFVGTSTFSSTWQDEEGTALNTNPIVLDQAGRAGIWGVGNYRQVVQDQFGNVQWDRTTSSGASVTVPGSVTGDLSVSGNTVISGSATIGGGLNVTGGETVTGAFTTNGLLTAYSGANIAGTLNTGTLAATTVNASSIGVYNPDGAVDFLMGDKILVRSGNTPGIAFGNTTDNLTMGWYEGGDALVSAIMDGTTGQPAQNLAFIVGAGGNVGSILTSGRMIQAASNNSPCVNVYNTLDGIAWSMQASSGVLQWGQSDANGFAFNERMKLGLNGDLSIQGSMFADIGSGGNLGAGAEPWNNAYAHNFFTVSTAHDSAKLTDGQLEVIKGIPVKTLPHIGLAAEDVKCIEGAVAEGGIGTSYAVLVGVLWKALQELSAKFDAYVAAHP